MKQIIIGLIFATIVGGLIYVLETSPHYDYETKCEGTNIKKTKIAEDNGCNIYDTVIHEKCHVKTYTNGVYSHDQPEYIVDKKFTWIDCMNHSTTKIEHKSCGKMCEGEIITTSP